MRVQCLGWEDTLGEEMATLFSIFAWKILWTEESGWLQSMGSNNHSGTTEFTHTHTHHYSDANEEGTQGVNLRRCLLSGSLPHQSPCLYDLFIPA